MSVFDKLGLDRTVKGILDTERLLRGVGVPSVIDPLGAAWREPERLARLASPSVELASRMNLVGGDYTGFAAAAGIGPSAADAIRSALPVFAADEIRRSFAASGIQSLRLPSVSDVLPGLAGPALAAIATVRIEALRAVTLGDAIGGLNSRIREIEAGLFRLPERHEFDRIGALAREYAASMPAISGVRVDTLAIARCAADISVPWIKIDDPARSLAGFSELAMLGRALGEASPFGRPLARVLREILGDWRRVSFDTGLALDPIGRSAFYRDVGLDSRLVSFPTSAFEAVLAHAGVGLLEPPEIVAPYSSPPASESDGEEPVVEPPPEHMRRAFALIAGLETQLRAFIDRRMTAVVGPNWIKQRVPPDMRGRWQERREAALESGMPDAPLIAYADFTDYTTIIVRSDNWRDVFRPVFRRTTFIEEAFARLQPFRLCTMHSRIFIEEDELLLEAEVRRLMRAILASQNGL